MKNLFVLSLTLILITQINSRNRILYLDPVPGAKYINVENNLIIGFENDINTPANEIANCIEVRGSKSLNHTGIVKLTADGKKIIFIPDNRYLLDEKITVTIKGKLAGEFSRRQSYTYAFQTSKYQVKETENENIPEQDNSGSYYADQPPVLPQITVTINNNPADGYLFLSNFRIAYNPPNTLFLIITDKNGLPYFYRTVSVNAMDFKKQPDGSLTYYDKSKLKFCKLDNNYNIIDSFYCGNGYNTDEHELRLLNNGHALLISYDKQTVNMSTIVQGGDTAALVTGLVVQEIDANKNVVFQWRSWDHFLITDALHEDLHAHIIDAVHGNAIELDNDGNLMISSRHLDEITKINRTTGAIIWRLGGLKNQFTFINDPTRFTYQHAIRRISNGHITLYDNGNYHTPAVSRAVEYDIDEVNKTATLVWSYTHTPPIFGMAMGYVQRLPNGNTLISWGTANPTVTEVTPQGTIAFEMTLPSGVYSYRVFKDDWNGQPTSAGNESSTAPKSFRLYQNYPNPFNPSTTITFDLPKASQTELTVYDVTGSEVKRILSEYMQAGSHKYQFDGHDLSSGLYFYKLTTPEFTSTQKMILVK